MSREDGPIVPQPGRAGRPPRDPVEWVAAFLENYELTGNQYASAKAAGVDVKTVRKHRLSHATFGRQVKDARRAFVASLQQELVNQARKGNVIATLARLKASGRRMAERYSEKAIDARVLNLTVNQYGAPADLPTWSDDDIMDSTRASLLRVPDAALPPDLLRLKHQAALPPAIEDAEIVGPPPADTQETP